MICRACTTLTLLLFEGKKQALLPEPEAESSSFTNRAEKKKKKKNSVKGNKRKVKV